MTIRDEQSEVFALQGIVAAYTTDAAACAGAILARYDLHPKGSVVVPAHLINAIIRIRRDIADFDGDRRGHYGALDDAEAALLDAIQAIAARPGASHE